MPARKRMTVEGLDALRRRLNKLDRSTAGEALDAAVLAGANPVRSEVASRAPRDSGDLSRGIGAELARESFLGRVSEANIGPEKDVYYGGILALGTRYISPDPFMRTGLDAASGDAVEELAASLRAAILRAVR